MRLEDVVLALLGLVVAFAGGVSVYVGVSFLHMVRHAEPRGVDQHVRELTREMVLCALVQPLLPWFYVVGRRLGGRLGGVPIVFVHGYFQNRVDFLRLAWVLGRRGAGPMYGFNYPWWLPVDDAAARLATFVAAVRAETGAEAVDLVCHSLGGLVAIDFLEEHGGATIVRKLVTIASPHAGVAWKGPILGPVRSDLRADGERASRFADRPLALPCLSVYSTHDNVVHPKRSSSLVHRGGTDLEVHGLGHLAILFSEEVACATASFLLESEPQARVA